MSMYDPVHDGTAAIAGFRSGDLIVGLEVCEVDDDQERAVEVDATSSSSPAVTTVTTSSSSNSLSSKRRKVAITDSTTDEEWVHFAQSCEQLQPGSDTVIWVHRKEKNTL